jgi:hypothetical protein
MAYYRGDWFPLRGHGLAGLAGRWETCLSGSAKEKDFGGGTDGVSGFRMKGAQGAHRRNI